MTLRNIAITALSSGLIALGSSIALAQSMSNADNTSPGESGHGTGCSNHAGGCRTMQESSATSTEYNTGPGMSTPANTSVQSPATTSSAPAAQSSGCMNVADATPGHCMRGPTR